MSRNLPRAFRALLFALGLLLAYQQVLAEVVAPEIAPQVGHPHWVTSVVVTPDGRNILSGSMIGFVKLWDMNSGAVVRSFQGQQAWSSSIAISPEGKYVVGGSIDGTIALWDRVTGTLVRSYDGHVGSVNSVKVTPDSKHIVSAGSDQTIKIWKLETGELLRSLPAPSVFTVAVTSDGKYVVSGGGDIKIWDLARGVLIRSFDGGSGVALTPDGRHVVSGKADNTIELRDLTTGALVRSFAGHQESIYQVEVTPDGRYIVTTSRDKAIKLWSLSTGALIRSLEDTPSLSWGISIAVTPDSRTLIIGRVDSTIELLDLATGKLARIFQGRQIAVRTMAVSPDDKYIVAGNSAGIIQVWDKSTGGLAHTIKAHSANGYRTPVNSIAVTSDSQYIVSAGLEDTIKLWELATGKLVRAFEHRSGSVSRDGRYIAAPTSDGAKLWDRSTGKLVRSFDDSSFLGVTPDGRHIVGAGKTIKLWDFETGVLIRSFEGDDRMISYAISPDGQYLVSGSNGQSDAKLWSLATGKLVHAFETHRGWVNAVTITPDSRYVVSGNSHGNIQLWDIATGALVRDYVGHQDHVTSLVVKGDHLVSGNYDGTVRIWDLASGRQLVTLMGGVVDNKVGGAVALTPQGFFAMDEWGVGADFLKVVDGLDVYDIRQFYQALYRPELVSELLKGDPEGKYELAVGNLNLRKILDSGPPPRVELKRTERIGDSVRVTVEITNQGGGIGKVEWRVDDVLLAGERGMTPASEGEDVLTEVRSFPLTTAGNVIGITAYNKAGLITAVPLVEKVNGHGIAESEQAKLFILAVGIDDYAQSSLRLNYAVNDAETFSSRFKTAAEGLGLFKEVSVRKLINAEVTRDGLDKVFTELAAQIGPEDKFVFFAAGHGKVYKDRYYFYPQDLRFGAGDAITSQGIDQDTWQTWFSRIPALASVLIYDTCEAGQMTTAMRGSEDIRTAIDLLKNATGRSILAATTAEDAAREGFEDHGVFTSTLR